jgi:cation transport ATPase
MGRAEVVHHTRGRIRVKVHGGKGNRRLLHEIKQSLAPKPGVRQVDVNPTTGSVIVHYDDRAHPDFHQALTEHGRNTGLFALQPPEISEVDRMAETIQREAEFLAAHSETARSIVEFVKSVDAGLKRATNNNLDLKVLLPLGMAVYAFLEVGAEVSTPLWVTLGIFSFNSFVALHPPLPSVSVETQQVIRHREGGPPAELRQTRRRPRQT